MNELRDLVELRMIHCSTQKFSFDRSEDGSLKKVWPPASKAKEPTLRKRPGNATQPAVQSSRSMYADSPSQLCIRNFESHTEQTPSRSTTVMVGFLINKAWTYHLPLSFLSLSFVLFLFTATRHIDKNDYAIGDVQKYDKSYQSSQGLPTCTNLQNRRRYSRGRASRSWGGNSRLNVSDFFKHVFMSEKRIHM